MNLKVMEIMGSLCGLVGAMETHGRNEESDKKVWEILSTLTDSLSEEESLKLREAIQSEKEIIAPDCAVCMSPCGNTSDYKIEELLQDPLEVQELKVEMTEALLSCLSRNAWALSEEILLTAYQAITAFKYSLQEESYKEIIKTLKNL